MRRKDRVTAALEGRILDRPPCGELTLSGLSQEDKIRLLRLLGADLVVVHLNPDFPGNEELSSSCYELRYFLEYTDYFVLAGIPGVFWQSVSELTLEVAARMIIKEPEKYRRVLQEIRKRRESLLERLKEFEVDGIFILDDLAGKNGPLFSPQALREFIFPELKTLVNIVKQLGKPVFLHSDGLIEPILQDLLDLDVDVLHGFDGLDFESLKEIKEIIHGRAAFMGNFNLHFNDAKSVLANLRSVVELFAESGYIFSSDGGFTPDSIENLVTLYQYFHQFWEDENVRSHGNFTA